MSHKITIGRLVDGGIGSLERGGDYCFIAGSPNRIYFLLPGARDEDAPPARRAIHGVSDDIWKFRHCHDGSIEVRASIFASKGLPGEWHGFLDEGHRWREC